MAQQKKAARSASAKKAAATRQRKTTAKAAKKTVTQAKRGNAKAAAKSAGKAVKSAAKAARSTAAAATKSKAKPKAKATKSKAKATTTRAKSTAKATKTKAKAEREPREGQAEGEGHREQGQGQAEGEGPPARPRPSRRRRPRPRRAPRREAARPSGQPEQGQGEEVGAPGGRRPHRVGGHGRRRHRSIQRHRRGGGPPPRREPGAELCWSRAARTGCGRWRTRSAAPATFVAVDVTDADAPQRVLDHVAGRARPARPAGQQRRRRLPRHVRRGRLRQRQAHDGPELRRGGAHDRGAAAAAARSAPSSIVNVSSTAGRISRPGRARTRPASSRWPAGPTRCAAEEAADGVHVGNVLPGFISTEGFPQAELTGKALTRWAVSTPEKAAEAVYEAGPGGKAERYVPRPYELVGHRCGWSLPGCCGASWAAARPSRWPPRPGPVPTSVRVSRPAA